MLDFDDRSGVWRYGRRRDGIELAVWNGTFSLPLSCHFHPEIQITTVLAGSRRFLTSNGLLTVQAGETLIVPPGLPHQALGVETGHTLSLNLYVRESSVGPQQDAHVVKTPRWLGAAMETESVALRDWVNSVLMRSGEKRFTPALKALAIVALGKDLSISDIASQRGVSREGFIRWFRRHVGMTPHAYRLAFRLNRARALLAADAAPAQAAAEAGFADQSHMGRQFRRTFGVAPGVYRCAVRTSA